MTTEATIANLEIGSVVGKGSHALVSFGLMDQAILLLAGMVRSEERQYVFNRVQR